MDERENMVNFGEVKTVTVCSSSKFYDTARLAAEKLEQHGVTVFTPRFEYSEEFVEVTVEEKMFLTRDFLSKIQRSDAIYVIDEEGYTGRSVCIEIGYARGAGKIVLLSEEPVEHAVMALADAVVPLEEMAARLAVG
ncbi:hypothetical protein [Streptomyces sp. NPDC096311]|uniref:hypothetical protein n=1 Tax=Streptomyces sp. NPDC096311 TaxID=3366083 RepID=UPI00382EF55B